MNYTDAIKKLGLKSGTTPEQIREKYIALAKKLHPDVKGGSVEKFQELSQAYTAALYGEVGRALPDYTKEYDLLRSKLGPDASDNELQDAEQELIKTASKEDPDALERIYLARKRVGHEMEAREILITRGRHKFLRDHLKTPEQKRQEEMEFMKAKLQAKEGLHQMHLQLQKIFHTHKIKGDKVHIPYMETIKGQKITRYAILTATLLGAIIAGKVIYDYQQEAFRPTKISGLLGGPQ